MNETLPIEIKTLIIVITIVSIETVGGVQFLKNFLKCKPGGSKRKYAIASFAVCFFCSVMNLTLITTPVFIPLFCTVLFNVVSLALAIVQMAWDGICKGIPKVVNAFFDKLTNIPISTTKD